MSGLDVIMRYPLLIGKLQFDSFWNSDELELAICLLTNHFSPTDVR
jgi:hypothetical protein